MPDSSLYISVRRFAGVFGVLLALFWSAPLAAQNRTVVGDSRGRDFWVCFPQNARLELNRTISLKLFITSDRATNGTITVPGLNERTRFHLEPSQIQTLDIDTVVQILESEKIQKLGVHIEADNDVAVFGLSHRNASTDSYLALPTNVLGMTYRAIGYYPIMNGDNGFATEFTMVATEDHTVATISLSGDSRGGRKAGDTYSIELNQGDTYMVHGDTRPGRKDDLSGSLVTTTKPVAFFVGHSCAQVPPDVSYCDQLLEEEPPIPSWGRQFYVGRYESKSQYALRVLASEDNTQIFVNNKLVSKLSAGQHWEDNHMMDNALVTASKPVLVAQYAQSSQADSIQVGDPFLMLITPTEQFLNYYRFVTPVNGQWHHYINLVVPMDAIRSLRVDGRPVPERYFKAIGISRYGVAQYEVSYGSHAIACDKPFGLYSYGFGVGTDNYDSYGNDGGQLVETIPLTPDSSRPLLELVSPDADRSLALIARDDRLFDMGLASITIVDSQNFRSPVSIPPFDPGTPEVPLLFKLYDTSACAFMSLHLTDVAGNESWWTICRTNQSGSWVYTLAEGRTNICPSCRSWTVEFITTPSFTLSDVTFEKPAYLLGAGTFDRFSSRLSGGFQGLYIFPINKSLQFAGGLGFSNFTGAAIAQSSRFVVDSILYGDSLGASTSKLVEDYVTEASVNYLNVNGGMYYYVVPEKFYLYAGLAAGFLLKSHFTESSEIVFPATVQYYTGRSTGSRSLLLAQGSLPDPTSFHIAIELAPGFEFKLSQSIALLAGAYMNLPFFDAVKDLNWHFTTFGARIGLRYRH
jgi:hypothetical protein